MHFILLNSR